MIHLSRDELQRWLQHGGSADRERIAGHLAICDECVALYRKVMDERPLDHRPAPASPDVVTAGHGAFRSPREAARPRRAALPARWLTPLAAAAAVVIAAVAWPWLRSPTPLVPPSDETVRSTTIQVISPTGTVTAPFVFEWSSPIEASAYELAVYDEKGAIVWSARTATTRVEAPEDLPRRARSGEPLEWQVTAINQRGERTIQSPRQRFAVSPRAP